MNGTAERGWGQRTADLKNRSATLASRSHPPYCPKSLPLPFMDGPFPLSLWIALLLMRERFPELSFKLIPSYFQTV